MKASKNNKN